MKIRRKLKILIFREFCKVQNPEAIYSKNETLSIFLCLLHAQENKFILTLTQMGNSLKKTKNLGLKFNKKKSYANFL